MSNLEIDLDDLTTDRGDDSDGIKSLRAALKQLKAQVKERDEELGQFRTKQRESSLSDLLRSKGVPDQAFGLYPKDAAATEEAVTEWVNAYGAVFGVTGTATPGLPQEQVSAMQQMQSASSAAPAATPGDFASLQARIQAANSREELHAVYKEFGLRPAS